jgi:hypothetical protein
MVAFRYIGCQWDGVSAQAPDDPTVQAAIAANWHG